MSATTTNLRPYLHKACEEVDASIFSGDVLYSDAERKDLREYVERWLRAINEHEATEAKEGGAA